MKNIRGLRKERRNVRRQKSKVKRIELRESHAPRNLHWHHLPDVTNELEPYPRKKQTESNKHQAATSCTYSRLEDGEVRILKLHPAKHLEDEIVCDLETHVLANCPAYNALSYAWGPATDMHHSIRLNQCAGQRVTVRHNLYQALRRLRYADHYKYDALRSSWFTEKVHALWIDALCINQEDLIERNKQVRIMFKIYSGASNVVAWLGEESSPDEGELGFGRFRYGPSGFEMFSNAHLWNFLRKPWFTRRWIVQEVYHARSLYFQYGDHAISRENAGYIFTGDNHRHFFADLPAFPLLSNDLQRSDYDMLDHLNQFSDFECSDDRDRIFSLLNCGSENLSYRPDYSMSTNQVYTDFARFMISEGYGPRVLLSATIRRRPTVDGSERLVSSLERLPSWVPDWRLPVAFMDYGCVSNFEARLSKEATSMWKAHVWTDGNILCVTLHNLGFVSRMWEVRDSNLVTSCRSKFETDMGYEGHVPKLEGLFTQDRDGEEIQPCKTADDYCDHGVFVYHDDTIIAFEDSSLAFVVRKVYRSSTEDAFNVIAECRLAPGQVERIRSEPLQSLTLV